MTSNPYEEAERFLSLEKCAFKCTDKVYAIPKPFMKALKDLSEHKNDKVFFLLVLTFSDE
jgi:hypothetical protein